MMKNLSVLGSTGSIGKNVLDVVQRFPGRFRIVGLAAGQNLGLLKEQIKRFQPELVSVADQDLAGELVQSLPAGWGPKVVYGRQGNERIAAMASADLVVSAIVGAAGLSPTFAAIRAGKDVALANKETLVMAGGLVMAEVRRQKVRLLPIDSEHSAIAQALAAGRREDVAKIILTASGGPFREMPGQKLLTVTPAEALNHPNWNMGRKISIDSATMMNKGLEVIEARWLFDIAVEKIEVLVHPQSIVHSLVEFVDGAVVAQMGIPDMRIPIAYALAYPERLPTELARLNLTAGQDLSFFPPDFARFPALALAYKVCKQGGTLPAALNAANEVAVAAFLDGKILFPEITQVVSATVNKSPCLDPANVEAVLAADVAARLLAEAAVASLQARRSAAAAGQVQSNPSPTFCPDY